MAARKKRVPFNGLVIKNTPDKGTEWNNPAKLRIQRTSLESFGGWMEKAVKELQEKFPNAYIQGTLKIVVAKK